MSKVQEPKLQQAKISLGAAIRLRREEWGWSRTELAKFLNKSVPHAQLLEAGQTSIDMLISEMLRMGFEWNEVCAILANET